MNKKVIQLLEKSRNRHETYFGEIERFYRFIIPEGKCVLEMGCRTGRLLASLNPAYGLGLDIDPECIETARELHIHRTGLEFICGDAENYDWNGRSAFDYVILSDLTPLLTDVQKTLTRLAPVIHPHTRLILNFHNNLWYPALQLASTLGLRTRHPRINWLSSQDILNFLYLSGFEVITRGTRCLLPFHIPLITPLFNRLLAKLPLLEHLCMMCFIIARPKPETIAKTGRQESVSIVIPTLNEAGNMPGAFERIPRFADQIELIFIDGGSTDGTVQEIQRLSEEYRDRYARIHFEYQTGKGKGQAVRQGFDASLSDILMILDSDLTTAPEDLPKFYDTIRSGLGDFINGSRLVYPMEKRAMRFLNMIANKMFALLFTWLIGQPIKDTLCGTKVLRKLDYQDIVANRSYFGDFDPFGDFDLIFGASRLNLKIIDIPIRYRERVYGDIKIQRWKHGLLLIRMCGVAFRKLKLS